MALKILNRILQNQDDRLLRSNLDPADLNKKGTGENIRQLSQSYSRAIASIFNAKIDEFCRNISDILKQKRYKSPFMKTKLILLFVVFLPFISSAQHTTIGPELSFLLSNNSEFEFSSFNNKRASFSYGVNFARQLSNKIYLETGFQYLTQGAKYETCYTFPEGEPNKIVVKRDYVIVPLNVLYGIGPNNNIKGTLGLFGAYNVKAIQDYPEPIGGCNIGHPRDLTNNTEQFYLGLLTGLSYVVFSNEILEIELGLEYYKNLTQINNFVNNNSIGLSSKFNLKL